MALFRFLLMLPVFMIVSAASDRISIFQSMIFFLVSRKFVTSKSIVAMDIVPPPPFMNTKGDCFQEQVNTFNMSTKTCD